MVNGKRRTKVSKKKREEKREGDKNRTLSSFDRPLWFLDNALNAYVNKFSMRCTEAAERYEETDFQGF